MRSKTLKFCISYSKFAAVDPQGSCYNFLPPSQRVALGDADFVEMVHCSTGMRSLPNYVSGNVTFIVNGGHIQPECANLNSSKVTKI